MDTAVTTEIEAARAELVRGLEKRGEQAVQRICDETGNREVYLELGDLSQRDATKQRRVSSLVQILDQHPEPAVAPEPKGAVG